MRAYAVVNSNAIIGIEYANRADNEAWIKLDHDDPRTVGWLFDGTHWKSPDGTQTYGVKKHMFSKLEFMNRFTDAELMTLYVAAKTSPALEVWFDKFKLSEFVDITDTRTVEGINTLETFGIIGTGRAAEILNIGE